MTAAHKIVPCLWFDTRAEEAARFYVSVFDNSHILKTTYFGPEGPRPRGTVETVSFVLDGQPFTALNGGPEFTFDEAVSFEISCRDQAETDYYWDTLTADGGRESDCGWLEDRFGLSWQVVPERLTELVEDPDPERASRATRAMLGMRRIDIAALERAADGTEPR